MGKNDLWIAATAHVVDATILTTDKDFDHLASEFLKCQVLAAAPPAAPSHDLSKSKRAAFAAILSLRFHQWGGVRR